MNEKFTPTRQEEIPSDEKDKKLHITRRGLAAAAIGGTLLGGALTHTAHETLTPEEIVSFTVESDINPNGDIYELQKELSDALSNTEINPDSISGIVEIGQQLKDGNNKIVVKQNTFHTWVELDLTPELAE